MTYSHAIETCGRQPQKRKMLSIKASSLVTAAQSTALD